MFVSTKKVKWATVSHATWAQFAEYCHLRLFLQNDLPSVRLDGFSKAQYAGGVHVDMLMLPTFDVVWSVRVRQDLLRYIGGLRYTSI